MKNLYQTFRILALLISVNAFSQFNLIELSGKIYDNTTNEPLVGVAIVIKGSVNGTTTDVDGKFKLKTKLAYPIILTVSYLGYETQTYKIENPTQDVRISLNTQSVMTNDVVVTASRVEESIMKSPITIEKLDIRTLRESPAPSFYDALENVKGVQLTSQSLTFKVPNTRGFNSPNNFRFMQMTDGVDMQAATLGVPLGNAVGPTELDIESVEITPGAASALYGMNAINGMANLTTKNPFRYQGLSVYQKTGVNHIDGKDRPVSPLSETAIRFAKAFNNKWAFKVNASFLTGTDWLSSNFTDQNKYTISNPKFPEFNSAENNPAADEWNRYGDETNNNLPISINYNGRPQTFNVRRTGYTEKDLTERNVQNIKFDAALHYRINEKWEASYSYRFGSMDGTFQRGNKIRLNDATVQNHKIELKSSHFTYRGYLSIENTGNSYNLKPLADNLDMSFKSNTVWSSDFRSKLQSELANGASLVDAIQEARSFADLGRPEAGSEAFSNLKNTIVNTNNWDHGSIYPTAPATGGAALWQRSRTYHNEVQYDFSHLTKQYVDVLAGADARVFEVIPDGNNFVDFSKPIAERATPGGKNVYYSKIGAFVQLTKRLLNDKVKLTGSVRYDKNLEFDGKFNPRLAVVYSPSKEHSFRVSAQNGYRFPALFEALSYVNNGNVRRVGGLAKINEGLGYNENSYTLASINDFNNAVNADVANGITKNQSAINNKSILQKANLGNMQPEQVTSFELGYKSILLNNSFVIDLDVYYSQYKGFLGQIEVAVPKNGTVGSDAAALDMLTRANQTRYRVFTNAKNTYHNYGGGLRLSYHLPKKYHVSGNLSYNDLSKNATKDVFVTGFNTPRFATNLSFGNKEIVKNLGFNIVWKWQSSFEWESPLANGTVPSFNTVDAQVTYKVPSLFLTAKVGGTNILNQRYFQFAAGPTIGALYYVALTFDGLLDVKKK